MPLLSVRLDPDDARKAAELREAGITISSLVREAIRREHARESARKGAAQHASQIVEAVLASLPDSDDHRHRPIDATNRRAVARRIKAKLRARRK
jgi:Arc/MetJ-type ribon-helix-helix transcriptional regulator